MTQEKIYNSRIIDTYIKYIKKFYKHVDINTLLKQSQIEAYEVADQNHWFTQEQVNSFHEKLVLFTENRNIAREAGRYSASPEAIGVMRQYILGMVDTASAYKMIGKFAAQFSRSSKYEAKVLNSKNIEIIVTPYPGVNEKQFQCENRIGCFEAIALAFNNTTPKIRHTECIFERGGSCRYTISIENSFSPILKRIRNISVIFFFLLSAVLLIYNPLYTFFHLIPAFASLLLLMSFLSDYQTKKELRGGLLNLEHSRDDLISQMDINYNNSLMVNEIGQTISKYTNIDDAINNVISILQNRLDYDRCVILMADEKKTKLTFRTGFGYTEKQFDVLKQTEFNLLNPNSKGIFVLSFKNQKPYLINDIYDIEDDLSSKSIEFVKNMGSQSFICCPIICDKKSIGILTVDNMKTKRALIESDISLLIGIASMIGISIKNAELHDARTKQFKSILKRLLRVLMQETPIPLAIQKK